MPLYTRVKQIASELAGSETKLAAMLELPQRKLNGYLNEVSQKNLWAHLPRILQIFPQVSRDWLYFGEGSMFPPQTQGNEPTVAPVQERLQEAEPAVQSVPVVGFASCGIQGWGGKMTFPLAVSAPHIRQNMIAVMATGESMIPEGIGHGHICFCDPHLTPLAGECVYVESIDGKAALKAFVGRGVDAGHNTKEHEICLRGWLDKQGAMPQKDFYLRIPTEMVQVLAPVVYVQRRL